MNGYLADRRIQLGLTQKDVANAVGVSEATVSRWESGQISNMRRDRIREYAKVLKTSTNFIMTGERDEPTIPDGFDPLPETVQLPLVGQIACGTPILAEENITDYLDVPAMWGADFCLQCQGDSMLPRLRSGDVVAIRKQPTVENGQIAAVRVDGEITLKHVYLSASQLTLVSENPEVPPMVYGSDTPDLAIVGLAVGFMRSLV